MDEYESRRRELKWKAEECAAGFSDIRKHLGEALFVMQDPNGRFVKFFCTHCEQIYTEKLEMRPPTSGNVCDPNQSYLVSEFYVNNPQDK